MAPRQAASALEIALKPSPLLRRLTWLFLLAMLLYGLELGLLGHWLMSPATLLAAALSATCWRRSSRADAHTPRRLLILSDGRICLLSVGGHVEEVTLAPRSLRLGDCLLLLLCSERGTHRLLLEPGNLPPGQLAALKRRLIGSDPRGESALHSIATLRARL